jgi:hypothetical protein
MSPTAQRAKSVPRKSLYKFIDEHSLHHILDDAHVFPAVVEWLRDLRGSAPVATLDAAMAVTRTVLAAAQVENSVVRDYARSALGRPDLAEVLQIAQALGRLDNFEFKEPITDAFVQRHKDGGEVTLWEAHVNEVEMRVAWIPNNYHRPKTYAHCIDFSNTNAYFGLKSNTFTVIQHAMSWGHSSKRFSNRTAYESTGRSFFEQIYLIEMELRRLNGG